MFFFIRFKVNHSVDISRKYLIIFDINRWFPASIDFKLLRSLKK